MDTTTKELAGEYGTRNSVISTQDAIRQFKTGATRSPLSEKLQYEGFISPIVLKRYAEYMHKHRTQSDGTTRDADNWQKGIPSENALDSMLRHVMDVWLDERGYSGETSETVLDSLCAIIFNASIIILNREREKSNESYDTTAHYIQNRTNRG